MGKKAQSAIEFIILVGAVMFFFVAFMIAIQGNIGQKLIENRNFAIQEVALNVQNELNLAAKASDGYVREFEVPLKAAGLDYDIVINEDVVYINSTSGKYAAAFPVAVVTGNLQKGTNIIKKENGEVLLNS